MSVGLVDGQPVVDMCRVEDRVADVDLKVVITARGQFVERQGAAEGTPFARGSIDQLLDLAGRGIAVLIQSQNEVLG